MSGENQVLLEKAESHVWSTHAAVIDRQEPVKGTMPCCKCGKISFYRVDKAGYCEGHRAEAYAAQAVFWGEKMGRIA